MVRYACTLVARRSIKILGGIPRRGRVYVHEAGGYIEDWWIDVRHRVLLANGEWEQRQADFLGSGREI